MKLWTIQPISVYHVIQEKGYYACDENIALDKNSYLDNCFRNAYDWLIIKMNEKIGNAPAGIKYPVWAWHTFDGKRKSSDLRARQGLPGEEMVRLEIDIPDNEVLLSDFDAWHFVLNDWYLPMCNNEEEWDYLNERHDSLDKKEREIEKIKSWDNIFDIEKEKNDWFQKGYYIQATFWILKKENIKKVKFFKSK